MAAHLHQPSAGVPIPPPIQLSSSLQPPQLIPSTPPSIARFGFLMPGDTHPETGEIIRMRTGNLWGDGVCVTFGVRCYWRGAACDVLTFYELTLKFQTRFYFLPHASTATAQTAFSTPATTATAPLTAACRCAGVSQAVR